MGAILFDLGGTHLRSAIVDDSWELREVIKGPIKNFTHGKLAANIWNELVEDMAVYVRRVASQVDGDDPIVISFPGPIDRHKSICGAPTVTGWDIIPNVLGLVANRTGRTVHILNDVSAAAWRIGEFAGADRLMVVTVSSGIGSKVFDRAHPSRVLDNVPYAGEIGHVHAGDYWADVQCDCGGKGHIGAISSGRGIERFARRLAREWPDRFARSAPSLQYGASVDTLCNEAHLVPAARVGDPWALEVIRTCTRPLANALLTATAAFGLEKVFIIGGFAQAMGLLYVDILKEHLNDMCDYHLLSECIGDLFEILEPNSEICLEGAAAFYRSRYYDGNSNDENR